MTVIRSLDGSAEIEDGRVSMHARDDEAALRLRGRGYTPLSEHEPVATLAITGEGLEADVDLTAADVDTLADALADVREEGADQ